jgi:hypothetical protein
VGIDEAGKISASFPKLQHFWGNINQALNEPATTPLKSELKCHIQCTIAAEILFNRVSFILAKVPLAADQV